MRRAALALALLLTGLPAAAKVRSGGAGTILAGTYNSSVYVIAEKDLTLAIAKRLRDRLQGDGFEVVLTREDDRFLSNEERARIANAADGDVLISLHGNGWFRGDRRGFSVGT